MSSFWKRDMSTFLFGKAPKEIRSMCWGLLIVGFIYGLLGVSLLLVGGDSEMAHLRNPAAIAIAIGCAVWGAVSIVAPFFIHARKPAGVVLARVAIIFLLIFAALAIIGALTTGRVTGVVPMIFLVLLGFKSIATLNSRQLREYMDSDDEPRGNEFE